MPKIILEGYIVVPESELEIVRNELKSHINLTREEEGCLEFQVVQDECEKNRFHVYEEFKNQAAFQYHQERVQTSHWGEITKNVERHYQIHEGG
ncbi:putative quinol monooxygenase [Halomonas sp. THAF12]|uniref:putative quinol monooxygenase n=1 Tax=Halomonas sp. B23F22_10 TaxID=3459515 RepID=UPI00373FC0F6